VGGSMNMSRGKKVLIGVVVVALVLVVVFRVVVSRLESNLEELNRLTIEDIDLNNIEDGTYEGSYGSFPVSAVVEVTVKNHEITEIKLTDHSNGQGQPAEVLPERVVEAQSLQVDVISGATYSSRVILKAIENSLNGTT